MSYYEQNLSPISWEKFKPLLNFSGNDLSDKLKAVIEDWYSLIEFRVNKGGFLDLFIKDIQNVEGKEERKERECLMDEIKELYPTLYKRVTIHECV